MVKNTSIKKLILSVAAFFCGSLLFSAEIDKSFIILESQTTHNLNPQLTSHSDDVQILTGLYEGLFTYNPQSLEPVPAVASNYKISRDKKRWTFKINPEACFSNGEKITADSVRKSWIQMLKNPAAPYVSLLDVVEGAAKFRNGQCTEEEVGIYAVDVNTLLIHLEKPANYLPKLLCHTAFSVVYPTEGVYSGPYVLSEQNENITVLTKNPYYWDKENVFMEQITFIQSSDRDENAYFYNTGMVDLVSAVIDYDKIINKNTIQFNAQFGTSYFFFRSAAKKGQEKSIWDIKEFRQALLEAIPWERVRQNYYFPAETYVYPLKGYPNVEGFNYTDTIEAKKIMDAAREKYGIPKDKKIPLLMELPQNSFSKEDLKVYADAWKELGVTLKIKETPGYMYYEGLANSKADICSYSWIGDFVDPLAFLELFRSDSSLNDSGWKNEKFDELLEKAAIVSDTERYNLLGQAESLLLDECVVIPLQHPPALNIVNTEEITGWSPNAFDLHPLKYIKRVMVPLKVPNVI